MAMRALHLKDHDMMYALRRALGIVPAILVLGAMVVTGCAGPRARMS